MVEDFSKFSFFFLTTYNPNAKERQNSSLLLKYITLVVQKDHTFQKQKTQHLQSCVPQLLPPLTIPLKNVIDFFFPVIFLCICCSGYL